MKIEISKFYENKTKKFLLPALKAYGKDFEVRFNNIYKFAVGIHDMTIQGHPDTKQDLIYIMIDTKFTPIKANSFLNWVREQKYYVKDYVSGSQLDSRKQMVVLKFPLDYMTAYKMFLQGKYSKMYTSEQKLNLFKGRRALEVFNKTDDALKDYVHHINVMFEYTITEEDVRDHADYSLPNFCEEEIFYYAEGDAVFFNETRDKTWIEMPNITS